MHFIKKQAFFVLALLSVAILLLAQCNKGKSLEDGSQGKTIAYLNWGDSAQYVGKAVCAECHADVHQSFTQTGMGQSFGVATQQKSAGHFTGDEVIYDSINDFYYQPYWKNEDLVLKEFRLKGRDTTHTRIQKIDFIIGSGQHTNSHLFSVNGFVFQAPFTFYTQKEKLDLPPGFEHGNNTRFNRPIGLECMSCHNAMPTDFVAGSENKYSIIPDGIDCERCHGPGSIHVNRIKRGIAADTSAGPDFSIVNPKRLTPALQFEICQRCHLQGNAVLAEGKSFFDFRPGMYLDSVMDIYLPRYENSESQFIMASHVDRFTMSQCFLQSEGQFVCTSCHNPHVSVQETNLANFNNTCKNCHEYEAQQFECTVDVSNYELQNGNCVACHMPSSGSIDIPHVTVHDHYIRKGEQTSPNKQELVDEVFLGLQSINTKKPGKRSRIRAYLQQYERFEPNPIFLDSAFKMLEPLPMGAFRQEYIHYYYLKNEPSGIVKSVEENGKAEVWLANLNNKSWDNANAWTAYRIAEAYRKYNDENAALLFINRAVKLAPNNPEFKLKRSSLYALKGNIHEAEAGYREVLRENPQMAEAWSDLGYVLLAQNEVLEAEEAVLKALALDPDYRQANLNLASVYLAQERFAEARYLLEEILKDDPTNQRVKAAIDYLNAQNLGT